MRHHGVRAAHFLQQTHLLPGLEERLHSHAHDVAALARLRGQRFILTNAPRAYAERVLAALGLTRHVHGVIAIEQMRMFGQLRPKPDTRMLRRVAARLGVVPGRCVLVEDTLQHQKAARRVGMRTVWMQRWVSACGHGPEAGTRLRRRPAYVSARVRTLAELPRGRW
jgi:putative hydrolase of the HAD superfamily